MSAGPLIFTDDLLAEARAVPLATRKFLHRWALFEGPHRDRARAQLEAAASLVPVAKRDRVLGQLYSRDDKQVSGSIGTLLLAKVLQDQGWEVEHEPDVAGGTPDLRIQRGGSDFFVEARHVAGDFGVPAAYQKVQAAVDGIMTRTPVWFETMEVEQSVSLRHFVASLRSRLERQDVGTHVYEEPGVRISYEIRPAQERETAVFLGWGGGDAFWFDDGPNVCAAIDEKLKKYRFPIIVALQGIETGDLFDAAEEALFGSTVIEIPLDPATGAATGKPRLARAKDSMGRRRNSDGVRIRSRLQALMPFEAHVTAQGLSVRVRLLANPYNLDVKGLEHFRPIPSLLPLEPPKMGYVGADGRAIPDGAPIRDEFEP